MALCDLLQLGDEEINKDRLYRGLDHLLKHKAAIEAHLSRRAGELFAIENDVLLYDVTSTYFEGEAEANPLAQRGYSRDHRPPIHDHPECRRHFRLATIPHRARLQSVILRGTCQAHACRPSRSPQ